MRKIRMIGATIGALILASLALASPAQAADNALLDQIGGLTVAAEDRTGYDRDLFGDYDRPALLAENFSAWPDCNGYYSLADNQCYTAAGEVDVDHIVALAEAWDSGASKWTANQLDEYAGDVSNLWLMTDNLNQSKGDDDAAEWLPSYGPAVCGYVKTYVTVKIKWKLSVDAPEKAALVEAAQGCGASQEPTAEPTTEPTTEPSASEPAAPSSPAAGAAGGGLPVTGAAAGGIAVGAVVLLAAGGVLFLAARRRRVTFTA